MTAGQAPIPFPKTIFALTKKEFFIAHQKKVYPNIEMLVGRHKNLLINK